jgi:hypothetical protein
MAIPSPLPSALGAAALNPGLSEELFAHEISRSPELRRAAAVRKVGSRFGNIVGLAFQARPFHGLRVAGAAENHFLAANHNHDVADPGIRITSDGNLRCAPNAPTEWPGRTLRGTTAFQRTQVPEVAAHAVQRENLMQGHTTHPPAPQDSFSARAGCRDSLPRQNAPAPILESWARDRAPLWQRDMPSNWWLIGGRLRILCSP